MATNAAGRKAGVRDWVDSTMFDAAIEPEKSYERTQVYQRDVNDIIDGCLVRELDIELDTIPAELMDLIERR